MILIDLEAAVNVAKEKTITSKGASPEIRTFPYEAWKNSLFYAIDMMDWVRNEKGLTKEADFIRFKTYWQRHHTLPKYYDLEDKQLVELFEDYLFYGVSIRWSEYMGIKRNFTLDGYD